MSTDTNELLKESIEASNRTTHAVKVFAKFILIQLLATTAALLYFLAVINTDATTLRVVVTLIIAFSGTVWALYVGWTELGLSVKPLPLNSEAPSQVAGEESEETNSNTPGRYFEQKQDSNKEDRSRLKKFFN